MDQMDQVDQVVQVDQMDQEEIRLQVTQRIIPAVQLENAASHLDDEFRLIQPEVKQGEIDEETNLTEILNSYSFIKLIVEIEKAFGIEFDDTQLDLSLFIRLGNFLDVIYEKKGLRSTSSV